jgi:hypothetical protein
MASEANLKIVCIPSENIVARLIEDEVIIVPLVAGIGDADDELYTLNPTGQAIWQKLNGQRTLGEVVTLLEVEFEAPRPEIEADVLGFSAEMLRRGILVEKSS